MYIVMVAAECAPVAKAGGLGDVVLGLSNELAARGNAVEVVLPKYDSLRHEHLRDLRKVHRGLWVPFHDKWIHCDVYSGFVDGLNCFLVESHSPHKFFDRGRLYGEPDDTERFAFFSRAVMELLFKLNKHPDIIHCHDWQTGLIPVLLDEIYRGYGMTHPRVCYTLHNVGHQGVTGAQILSQVGLDPGQLATPERLLDHTFPDAINLMKGGIVYAHFVTTVSPRYAGEIKHSSVGQGLQQTLKVHGAKFGGVLNGLDYGVWNPETDPHIAYRYSAAKLADKSRNKEALRTRLRLRHAPKPIVAVVSRLDRQKGSELIQHAIHYSLARGCQFVLLGSALEPPLQNRFWGLKQQMNDNPDCHLDISYDEDLAHKIFAGADMLVVPSVYEPCGLTQMIAMRYGDVPIVRSTGGLADTVSDANYAEDDFFERNGYVFDDYTTSGLESAMRRAIGLWYKHPQYFRQLRLNAMRRDYSWSHPGRQYLDIYNYIRQ
jgi:starch synthase